MSRRATFSASFSWRRRAVERVDLERAEAGRGRDRRGCPTCSGRESRRRRAAAAASGAAAGAGGRGAVRGRAVSVAAVALDVARARPPSRPVRRCRCRSPASRSMPCAAATRRATGVLGVSARRRRSRRRGGSGGCGAARRRSRRRPRPWWAPSSGRRRRRPAPRRAPARPGPGRPRRSRPPGRGSSPACRRPARGPRRRPCRSRPRRSVSSFSTQSPSCLCQVRIGPLRHRFPHLGHRDLDGVGHVSSQSSLSRVEKFILTSPRCALQGARGRLRRASPNRQSARR